MFPMIRNALAAFCLLLVTSAHAQFNFSALFVFGDSLSDDGNLKLTAQVPFLEGPPYLEGRFSNGPVAVELLADELGLTLDPALAGGTNFAVAGATAGGESAIDLNAQLINFFGATGGFAPPTALYIVFFGGNDIRNTSDSSNREAFRTLFDAANNVRSAVQQLIDAGAANIMVVNAPDIGRIPETALNAVQNGDPGLPRRLSFRSRVFNFFLNRNIRRLQRNNDAQIVPVDLFNFFTFLRTNGEDLGYANSTDACFVQTGPLPTDQIYNPACDFDEFLFFDAIHPTAVTHARAANILQAAVPAPGDLEVPEIAVE